MSGLNPTKEVVCNFPLDEVVKAIKSLPQNTESAILDFQSDSFNYFKFLTTGKKSMKDLVLEIAVSKINENQTRLILECRGKTFTETNLLMAPAMYDFINGCISLTGKLLAQKD